MYNAYGGKYEEFIDIYKIGPNKGQPKPKKQGKGVRKEPDYKLKDFPDQPGNVKAACVSEKDGGPNLSSLSKYATQYIDGQIKAYWFLIVNLIDGKVSVNFHELFSELLPVCRFDFGHGQLMLDKSRYYKWLKEPNHTKLSPTESIDYLLELISKPKREKFYEKREKKYSKLEENLLKKKLALKPSYENTEAPKE